jgi:N-acetylglucosamine-6-phosphate deacetylase
MVFSLTGATVFDGDVFLKDAAVMVDGDKIVSVGSVETGLQGEIVRLNGGFLVPGFIDVQVNGGGGALVNDNPSIDTVRLIASAHRKFGTVGMLPTVITDAPDVISAAIHAVSGAVGENVPGVLGIHIEGPFLDVVRKGAHAARFIRKMTTRDIKDMESAACGIVVTTVAPNCVSPKQIAALVSSGNRVSLGHSDASSVQALTAVRAGATAFTHLYNAMSQMTGREPGMVGAALSCDAYVGLIADGHHVHPDTIRATFRTKGAKRCMLITDAMPTAAGGPASFMLQKRKVTRRRGRLTLADGTLAGSNLTMDEAVRFCVTTVGLELSDALQMASRTPATFLGRGTKLGRIKPGYLASLVHLSDDLHVLQTWINGT